MKLIQKPVSSLTAVAVLALLAGEVAAPRDAAASDPVIPIVKFTCPLTGPGVAACVAAGTVLHEVLRPRPFGPNGEGMKLLRNAAREFRNGSRKAERTVRHGARRTERKVRRFFKKVF